ncbi:unnamed protein product [Prunus armeniaca]
MFLKEACLRLNNSAAFQDLDLDRQNPEDDIEHLEMELKIDVDLGIHNPLRNPRSM